jgi:hypothetical protein
MDLLTLGDALRLRRAYEREHLARLGWLRSAAAANIAGVQAAIIGGG